jgi:hypothetical protein
MLMRELRWQLRRNRGTEVGPRADRCRSCAFQPGTDSHRGFESTALGLLNSLRNQQPFFCHAGMARDATGNYLAPADLDKARLCAGWLAVAEAGPGVGEDVERMARRALRRAGEMPS